jgi:hypothetical protein
MSRSTNGWDIGHRLDFCHLQHSEVGLPLMESIQWIIVGAEIIRRCLPSNRSMDHAAQAAPSTMPP